MDFWGLEVPPDCFASMVSGLSCFTRRSAISSSRRTSSRCWLRHRVVCGSDTHWEASAFLKMEGSQTTVARPHLRPEISEILLRARTGGCGRRPLLVYGDSTVLTGSTSDL